MGPHSALRYAQLVVQTPCSLSLVRYTDVNITGPRTVEEPISLVPYDLSWPQLFAEERAQLEAALSPWLTGGIEHIGSTAVPGLIAKPVIDMMAPVRDLPSSMDARLAVAQLGYQHFPYRSDVMHWFCKPSPAHRTHHLHLVPFGSELWNARLLFRDQLRRCPETAAEYGRLKLNLAAQYRFDREAYTDGKSGFIEEVLERATLGDRRSP